jgi:hypothetical protein
VPNWVTPASTNFALELVALPNPAELFSAAGEAPPPFGSSTARMDVVPVLAALLNRPVSALSL